MWNAGEHPLEQVRKQQPNIQTHPSEQWPSDGLEPVPQCPVCGSAERDTLYADLVDTTFFCAPGQWTMRQCQGCRTAYLDPRPSAETLPLAYRRYYTHDAPLLKKTIPVHGLKLLRRALWNGYRNARYGSQLKPAIAIGRFVMWLFPAKRRGFDRKYRHLPHGSGRVLDFGCGNGAFLHNATSLGWGAVGVDLDPSVAEAGRQRGLDVRLGGLEVLENLDGSFDAVTASHVIEHVADSREMLRSFFRVLKPGGLLYLEAPNIDAIGHKVFGRHWRGLEAPRHLVLFDWDTAEQLLSETGFVDMTRHPKHEVFGDMWRQSVLIRAGMSPQNGSVSNAPQPRWRIRLQSRFDWRRSEFVTVTARKPR